MHYLNILLQLADEVTFYHNNYIYRVGDEADYVYIIKEGEVEVARRSTNAFLEK